METKFVCILERDLVEQAFEFLSQVVMKSLSFQYNSLHLDTVQILNLPLFM